MLWNKIFLFQFIRIVMDGIMILDHGADRLRAFLCHWLHYNTWIVILRTFSIMQWYFTQLTVTLLNYRKVWNNLSHISSVFCTTFCKRVHCDGSTSGFATSATITVNEFAKNSAKNTRNVTKILLQIFLQFCNVTVSCVGYWPTQMRTLSIICLHFFDIFSSLCVKKKSVN